MNANRSLGPEDPDSITAEGWWVEEVGRGGKQVLIVMKGAFPRGSIEMDTYEEKVAWIKMVKELRLTLLQRPS